MDLPQGISRAGIREIPTISSITKRRENDRNAPFRIARAVDIIREVP